jgi:1-acylglycerone phosphate reductase
MKSVLITGCSKGGIGDALAQEFHSKGLRVFATARNLQKVKHLKELGLDVLELDVTSKESIRLAVAAVEKETNRKLDFLVNNAGMGKTLVFYFPKPL